MCDRVGPGSAYPWKTNQKKRYRPQVSRLTDAVFETVPPRELVRVLVYVADSILNYPVQY